MMKTSLRLLSILCLMAAAACAEESVDTSGSAGNGASGSAGGGTAGNAGAAGDGGSAGDAGQGGSAGDAGAAGEAGNAGAGNGGDGGSAGDAGAGGDAGAAGDGGSAGAAGGDTCYTPTPLTGSENFVAKDGDNERTYTFKTPEDPESGPVTITISGKQILGSVKVQGSEEVIASLLPIEDGPTASVSFAAAPGVTYEIHVQEFSVSGTLGEVEQPVVVSWSLAPLQDCYEPNNTPEQAAPLPLGETISAFFYAGATASGPTYDDYTDFYAITVDKAGKLRVEHDRPGTEGSPIPATLALFRAGEETELAGAFELETLSQQVEADVTPGTYLVRIYPFVSLPLDTGADEPLAHWSPYTLKATLE